MKKYHKNESYQVRLSKTLSWLLRHGAVTQGLKMNPNGYILLDEVLQYLAKKGNKNLSFQTIQKIVETNDKKRYQLQKLINPQTSQKQWYIRATQGHSIKQVKTQQLLKKIQNPLDYPVVIHGTYKKFWPLIQKQGLKRMTRLHIHFAPGYPKQQGVISGMRSSCDIYIQIDLAGAMKDGIQFYISSNNVILTQGIDGVLAPKYFKNVVNKAK